MDREALEQRLAKLQLAIEQTLANLNVLIGRRDELQFLLSEMPQEEVGSPAAEIGDSNGDDNAFSG